MGNSRSQDLSIRLLGDFEVIVYGSVLGADSWASGKAADLVKLLALTRGHSLHREQAIEALWPQLAPDAAGGNLRKALHFARRVLDPDAQASGHPFIGTRDEFVTLRAPGELSVDTDVFREATALARRSHDPELYSRALAFYRGDLLPGDPYEEWAIAPREELRDTFLSLLVEQARLYEAADEPESAIEALDRALRADPLNEQVCAELMRLNALAGRREQALSLFRQFSEVLQKALDAEPQDSTRRLYKEIESGRFPAGATHDLRAQLPAKSSAPRRKHNLPAQLTTFVERKGELLEIQRLLAPGLASRSGLLTLTGAGGSGKTRLAIEVAERLVENYKDGAWLVELAGLSDPSLVPQAVALALGVRDQPGRSLIDTLSEYLQARHLLLVLDNCEHLIGACAQLADILLHSSGRLQILATSREPLNISGETTWLVPSLSVPERDPAVDSGADILSNLMRYEAPQLFADRAASASSNFKMESRNASSVAQICRRLDGIPLAIELAAARVRMLSTEQIVERLDHSFLLLTGGSRTALPRHQTLRAAVDWSFELLDPIERTLFCRLSVFAGGFTLEAVEEVCSDEIVPQTEVLDILSRLIDKSLVVVKVEAATGASTRYHLLETLRQYGREKLSQSGAEPALLALHAHFYAVLCAEAEPSLHGPALVEWIGRLNNELDNLWAALEWCRANDAHLGLLLASSIPRFWDSQGFVTEVRSRLDQLLALDPAATEVRARALYTSGFLASRQGDNVEGKRLLEESLALYTELGDEAGMATALERLGVAIALTGDTESGIARVHGSVALFRRIGYKAGLCWALASVGMLARMTGQYEQAQTVLNESYAIAREISDLQAITYALNNLGQLARTKLDYATAWAQLEECLQIAHRTNNKPVICWTLEGLATVARMRGDYSMGWAMLKESMELAREIGYNRHLARCIYSFAILAVHIGEMDDAVRLFAATQHLHPTTRLSLDQDEVAEWDATLETASAAFDEKAFNGLWAEGEMLSWDMASDLALKVVAFGPKSG